MDPKQPVEKLAQIGQHYAAALRRLGIETAYDLILHTPFRYEELGDTKLIKDLQTGLKSSIKGQVLDIRNLRTKYGKSLTLAVVNDGTASIQAVWFNQHFLTRTIKVGSWVSLAGKVESFSGRSSLVSPTYELISPQSTILHTRGVIPVYPETRGLTSKWLRSKVKSILPNILPNLEETLPPSILKENDLLPLTEALNLIHFPKTIEQAEDARKRLAFEELLKTELLSLKRKLDWEKLRKAPSFFISQEKILNLMSKLPFVLTSDQNKVIKDILTDLSKNRPMNRLLQGDVGSGKTVVAAVSSFVAFLNGFQTALMAPTEILAQQHFRTVKGLLEGSGVKIGLFTSSRKDRGVFDVLVGTHALLSKSALFENLGLVIVDEQHRFGVQQRGVLRSKGLDPHFLTMTATPIPRSLALTYFGDLDISLIEKLPEGRQKIKTYLVPPEKRTRAYNFVREQLLAGRQAFIICPLIEPSETLGTVKAASAEFLRLKTEVFTDIEMGLLHGRMKSKEKETILSEFARGNCKILVSTPVVEVGIDIPNASIMIIEAAERFGLASLHQLRGRVGRGAHESYCLLFTENQNPRSVERLKALEKYHSGLKLAEIDLQMRGPGEIFGTVQSGLPDFKFASLTDLGLIEQTRRQARKIVKDVKNPAYEKWLSTLKDGKPSNPD